MEQSLKDITESAIKMREAQKDYFSNRTAENLAKSKSLEKALDKLLNIYQKSKDELSLF